MLSYLFSKTPLLFFVQSFWRDEAFSYVLAKHSLIDILSLTVKDFNPPLYYVILHFWINIFGYSEIMLRSLSLVFFGLTIYMVYDILTEICKIGKIRSLFYLLLFILNPLLIYYAFEARMYTMIMFFATLSFYAFYLKKTKLFIVSAILGLYTHYFMVFALFTQFVWSLLYQKTAENLKSLIRTFIVPVLAFTPWVIFMLTQKNLRGEDFWIDKPVTKDIWYVPSVLYTGFEKGFAVTNYGKNDYTTLVTQILFIILAIIFAYLVKKFIFEKSKSLPPVAAYLMMWGLLPPFVILFSSFFFTPTYLPKYMIFASVGLILFLVYALEQLHITIRVIFLLLIISFTNTYQTLNLKYREKSNFALKATQVKSMMKDGDLIYVDDEKEFHTSEYYFQTNKIYIYGKRYQDIPSYVGKVLIPEESIVYTYPTYPRRAFVIRYNNGFEIKTEM